MDTKQSTEGTGRFSKGPGDVTGRLNEAHRRISLAATLHVASR